jgi:hypothetical protein
MDDAFQILDTGDGIQLRLRRSTEETLADKNVSEVTRAGGVLIKALEERKGQEAELHGGRTPVLLLHGASAGSQTFEFPKAGNLVDFLLRYTNLEPWLLDWRGSRNITERFIAEGDEGSRFDSRFDFDGVAHHDIPETLRRIRESTGTSGDGRPKPLRIFAHCMGAASLSAAIASGELDEQAAIRPDRIVLSTIGLFYEVSVDGRLKAQDHMLERLLARREGDDFIDPTCDDKGPKHPWDPKGELGMLYGSWPEWLRPHAPPSDPEEFKPVLEMCNRLSFMYGEPYYEPALRPEIHADPTELAFQFGAIPLRMYVHAARCVRRRWAVPFNLDDDADQRKLIGSDARKHFDSIDVTLITGAMNRLWHRDSVDRMYEWLKRGTGQSSGRYEKIVFMNNGHQDLLWGKNCWDEVFPRIAQSLTL